MTKLMRPMIAVLPPKIAMPVEKSSPSTSKALVIREQYVVLLDTNLTKYENTAGKVESISESNPMELPTATYVPFVQQSGAC